MFLLVLAHLGSPDNGRKTVVVFLVVVHTLYMLTCSFDLFVHLASSQSALFCTVTT